jgi:alkylated DNA repair dioxygenase AlkB
MNNTIISKKTLLQENNSFLKVYSFNNITLVENCINDTDGKLIKNPAINLFGKIAYQHRCIAFFSDQSIGYSYSNQIAKSQPLTPNFISLLRIINNHFGTEFNGILVNKYVNGQDYIGFHSDADINPEEGVIMISYGAVRKFRIKDLNNKTLFDVSTLPNEIIHMGGDFQKYYKHGVPIQKTIRGERYSLTFRHHLR